MASGGNNLGSGVVVLTTNADGLTSGMAKAGADLKKFGEKAGADLKGGIARAAASGEGGGSGGMIAGLIGAMRLVASHPFIAAAAAAGLAAGVALVVGFQKSVKGLSELGSIDKRAGTLGVSASDLMGMDQMFKRVGVEADEANHVLALMGKNLLQNEGAAAQLSRMHIVPAELHDKSLTDQFRVIADGINRLPRGAEQATAAMAIFGKSGDQLLPMLQRGSKGIEEFIKENKEWGAILSDSQLRAVAEASKAWREAKNTIGDAFEGLKNRLVLIAAPVVKGIGEAVSNGMKRLAPVFAWIGRSLSAIGDVVEAVWDNIEAGASEFNSRLNELSAAVEEFFGPLPTAGEAIRFAFKGAAAAAGNLWDTLKLGAAPFANIIGMLLEGLGKLTAQFKDTIRSVLQTANAVSKVLDPTGLTTKLTGAALKNLDALPNHMMGLGKDLQEWANQSVQTWGLSGMHAATWFNRVMEAFDKKPKAVPAPLFKPPDPSATKFAGAIERGSKEAYSIEMRSRYGDFAKQNDIPNKQLAEAQSPEPQARWHQVCGRKASGIVAGCLTHELFALAGLTSIQPLP